MAYNYNALGFEGPYEFAESRHDASIGEDLSMTGSWLGPIDPAMFSLPPNYHTQSTPMTLQIQQDFESQMRAQTEGPMYRYINEAIREGGGQIFMTGLTEPGAPIHILPQATFRRASPSLSQGISSSSSVQSPGAEVDWSYYPQGREAFERNGGLDYYPISPPSHLASPPPSATRPSDIQYYSLPRAGNSCVNMSDVQRFTDPQELPFETDEGYEQMEIKGEYMLESEKQDITYASRQSQDVHDYHYQTDSAIGTSIRDANSPEDTSIHVADDGNSDIDAEGEIDEQDPMEVEPEPVSDTEYTPNKRPRKRNSPNNSPLKPTTKRSRVSKSSKNSKPSLSCKSCNAPPFKDAYQLARHTASAHTRPFMCVFAFAGCASTFASKNEWKRHVSSQHLNLTAYVCTLGACGKPSTKSPSAGAEFNRKDLFTQHLKRMHAPHSVKRKKQPDEHWEQQIRDLQVSCLKVKRQAPEKLRCPLKECGEVWDGPACWDERMEHVGKHLERASASNSAADQVDQSRDKYFLDWALREGIIESRSVGGYRLCAPGFGSGLAPARRDEDRDGE